MIDASTTLAVGIVCAFMRDAAALNAGAVRAIPIARALIGDAAAIAARAPLAVLIPIALRLDGCVAWVDLRAVHIVAACSEQRREHQK